MCLCNKLTEVAKPKSPRSPWRRSLKEPMKPRLSRKIVSSARVNLNVYWSKFEELSKQTSAGASFNRSSTVHVLNNARYSSYHDNEINENLVNELMELGNK